MDAGNDVRSDEAAAVRNRHALEIAVNDAGIQVEAGQTDTAQGRVNNSRTTPIQPNSCNE